MKAQDKVVIAFPHSGSISTELALSFIDIARERKHRIDSIIGVGNISLLTRSRNLIVKHFLDDTKAQWLLMVDSDEELSLPVFDLLCATANETERPFVAGLVFAAFYEGTQLRPVPVIYRNTEDRGLQPWDDYPHDQVVEIDASGTGCIMIHRSVLVKMRETALPNQGTEWCWFQDGAIAGRWFSEDLLFCRRVAALGFPMHAHTGAILPHKKTFWLDQSHHNDWRQANQ
jgi:hypothetical protein